MSGGVYSGGYNITRTFLENNSSDSFYKYIKQEGDMVWWDDGDGKFGGPIVNNKWTIQKRDAYNTRSGELEWTGDSFTGVITTVPHDGRPSSRCKYTVKCKFN